MGFGRFGAFSAGSSTVSWYSDMEPFETGYLDAGIQATQVNARRLNSNAVYFITPVFNGFKLSAQYSFTGEAAATQEAADFYDNNRFANLALRWDGANGRALLGLEWERFGQDAVDDAGAPVAKRDDA